MCSFATACYKFSQVSQADILYIFYNVVYTAYVAYIKTFLVCSAN